MDEARAKELRRSAHKSLLRLAAAMGVFVFAAGCATPGDLRSNHAHRKPQPVVTKSGRILEDAAATEALAKASGETSKSDRQQLQKLTNAVRRTLSAPLIDGNRVAALVDGPETFAAIDKAVMDARSHIHLETYIFADDELGRNFSELLISKRQQGVEVRVIYDAIGSIDTPEEFFDNLRSAGIEIIEFHPLNPVKTWLGKINNRDHRKILIVDGQVAFTGGMNISSAYASGSITKPGPELGVTSGWRDTDVRIEGPAVAQFQTLFLDAWQRLGGAIEHRKQYFPDDNFNGDVLVSAVASNSDKQKEEEIYGTYLTAIENCSERIWITQAYFSPPADLRAALIAAVNRGIDVRIIVPGFTDSKVILYAAHSEYDRLLRGGVRIFEEKNALLHAKTALIDETVVMIGSANLDYRSFLHNNEVTAVIVGEEVSARMATMFTNDLSNCHELTLEEWRKRPQFDRVKEKLSTLIKFWL